MPAITVKPISRLLGHHYLCHGRSIPTHIIRLAARFINGRRRRQWIFLALLIFAASSGIQAQTLKVRIAVSSTDPARIRINAAFAEPTDVISFPNAYGGILGLADRIENVEALAAGGQVIAVKTLAPGEFQTSEKFDQISY